MARVWKGRQTTTFPPLRGPDDSYVESPEGKAELFCQKFFPTNPTHVEPSQPDDPEPLPTWSWNPITDEEVTRALADTSNKSAPGPSGVGYKLLKWSHGARPDILTLIFNLSLDEGMHIWKHANVVILNKPLKPDYSVPKAYRPISLLECTGKLMEKIIAK
jgi:hypothetical protein